MLHAAFLLASVLAPQQTPGLIDIPAGQTQLGAELKDLKDLMEEKPQLAPILGGELPRSTIDVPAFRIGPTEVTNEMYQRFVEATGYQPPMTWLVLSNEELQALIREEQAKNPAWKFEGKFKADWWDRHWQDEGRKWEMPADQALYPVVAISQRDAHAYCEWAGLRLPTEEEWVRAARGDDGRNYPFGEAFDAKLVSHNNTKPANLMFKLLPANALPGNASVFGCVDMVGNAWEWTDSRYKALPDFKSFTIKGADGKKAAVLPAFDGSSPVIRGGSYMDPEIGARIDRRQGVMSVARAEHIGFRVASSLKPCANQITYALLGVETSVLGDLPEDAVDPEDAIGFETRRYADLDEVAGKRAKPTIRGLEETATPETYAVFDGHDGIALAPIRVLDEASTAKLDRTASERPVPVGVFSTTTDLAKPNLTAGTYVLCYVPPMKDKDIIAIGAGLPAELAEKAPKSAKKNEEYAGPDFAGIELLPDKSYLALVDDKNVAVAVVEMKGEVGTGTMGKVDHKVVLNLAKKTLDYAFRVGDARGKKAFTFEFSVVPAKPEMLGEGYWDGEYEVKVPKE